MLFRSTTAGDVFTYFLAPTGICNGAGIKSGTFYFHVNDTSAMGTLDTSRTSGYTTTNLNAFNFPVNYQQLPSATGTYSKDETKYTVKFGAIGSSKHFWFTTFYKDNVGKSVVNLESQGIVQMVKHLPIIGQKVLFLLKVKDPVQVMVKVSISLKLFLSNYLVKLLWCDTTIVQP